MRASPGSTQTLERASPTRGDLARVISHGPRKTGFEAILLVLVNVPEEKPYNLWRNLSDDFRTFRADFV